MSCFSSCKLEKERGGTWFSALLSFLIPGHSKNFLAFILHCSSENKCVVSSSGVAGSFADQTLLVNYRGTLKVGNLRYAVFYFNCLSRELFLFLCLNLGRETQFRLKLVNLTLLDVEYVTLDLTLNKVPKSRASLPNEAKSVLGSRKIPVSQFSWGRMLLEESISVVL